MEQDHDHEHDSLFYPVLLCSSDHWTVRKRQERREAMKLSNKTYDTLKLIALIGTPVITFLAALCTIWNVPHCQEITASLAALDALLGAILAKLSIDYKKENMKQ